MPLVSSSCHAVLVSLAAQLAPQPVAHRAHEEFLLRLSAGPGVSAFRVGEGGREAGFAVTGSIAAGWHVWRTFAVGLDLFFHQTSLNLSTVGSEAESHSLTTFALGAGLTWYTPVGPYLAASIGPASAHESATVGGVMMDVAAGSGWGMSLLVGHEWWVSPRWGLGAALHVTHEAIDVDAGTYLVDTIAVLFSATFD
jgi:hypothetical protein